MLISLFNLKWYKNFRFILPEELKKFQEEQRQWDMMFLIRRLIATNSKQGGAFLDVLIDNYLDFLCENVCGEWYRHYNKTIDSKERNDSKEDVDHGQIEFKAHTELELRHVGEIIVKSIKLQGKTEKFNAVLVTDQNETLAYLLNKCQDLFNKVWTSIPIQGTCLLY